MNESNQWIHLETLLQCSFKKKKKEAEPCCCWCVYFPPSCSALICSHTDGKKPTAPLPASRRVKWHLSDTLIAPLLPPSTPANSTAADRTVGEWRTNRANRWARSERTCRASRCLCSSSTTCWRTTEASTAGPPNTSTRCAPGSTSATRESVQGGGRHRFFLLLLFLKSLYRRDEASFYNTLSKHDAPLALSVIWIGMTCPRVKNTNRLPDNMSDIFNYRQYCPKTSCCSYSF